MGLVWWFKKCDLLVVVSVFICDWDCDRISNGLIINGLWMLCLCWCTNLIVHIDFFCQSKIKFDICIFVLGCRESAWKCKENLRFLFFLSLKLKIEIKFWRDIFNISIEFFFNYFILYYMPHQDQMCQLCTPFAT